MFPSVQVRKLVIVKHFVAGELVKNWQYYSSLDNSGRHIIYAMENSFGKFPGRSTKTC
ncbi:hypothetical protein SAMN05443144_109182 [Fodinibius roseus]|uniref:Uncharacterized protein n=1 Tax=Fodinibius roseus TaxID=1194090 RepID=A0A1M5CCI6_9BACT|nr:hypothetical protein SAMN05443144_109182 [Fodinibius roseus]